MLLRCIILAGLILFAFALNIPLGLRRAQVRKYSLLWFVYLHLSIPIIAGLRIGLHFGYLVIPLLLAAAIAGQIVGGRRFMMAAKPSGTEKPRGTKNEARSFPP